LPQMVNAKAQLCSLEGGPVPHLLCGPPGGGDSPVDIRRGGYGHIGDVLARYGRAQLIDLSACSISEPIVDVELEVACHSVQETPGNLLRAAAQDVCSAGALGAILRATADDHRSGVGFGGTLVGGIAS